MYIRKFNESFREINIDEFYLNLFKSTKKMVILN